MAVRECNCITNGKNDLRSASRQGHHECVEKLCHRMHQLKPAKKYKLYRFGEALCEAAGKGHTKIMEVLLHQGTDVNFNMVTIEPAGCNNETPLLRASAVGHTQAVELLLNSGAEINLAPFVLSESSMDTKQSKSAVIIASMHGHTETVKLLLSRGADRCDEALGYSVQRGHTETAEAILQHGESPNCLHHMSFKHYSCFVQPKQICYMYNTPVLMLAVQKQHLELLSVLLKWGANANDSIRNISDPETFDSILGHITYATCCNIQFQDNRWLEVIKLLLLHNADVRNAGLHLEGTITPFSISISAIEYVIKSLWTREKDIIKQCVLLLNAAGANTVLEQLDASFQRHPSLPGPVIWEILPLSCSLAMILPNNSVQLSLVDLCRDKVRRELLHPARGNNNNLFTAVPKLPLPQRLKNFLLFHVEITISGSAG